MPIVFEPTANVIGPDAFLDVTTVPFTFIVAVVSSKVGVTVTELVALGTLEV